MQFTHEEFLKMQAERQAQPTGAVTKYDHTNSVSFLKLNPGEKVLIRFAFNSPDELPRYTVHGINIGGKFRKVNCLRGFYDPIAACPLCAAGERYKQTVFIPALKYVVDENGQLKETHSVVFERPSGFLNTLKSCYTEYGNLADQVFTLERIGSTTQDTRYNLLIKNATIFNKQAYPADFKLFENFNPMKFILDKPYNEVADLANQLLIANGKAPLANTTTNTSTVNSTATANQYGEVYQEVPRTPIPAYEEQTSPVFAAENYSAAVPNAGNPVRRVTY